MTSQASNRLSFRVEWDLVTVAAVLLVALQAVVRLVVTLPSYFWQDDFIHLEAARREGLSWEFLLRDYNDHLEIGINATYWLLSTVADRSFVPAALLICALQALAGVLFWRLLRAVFGAGPLILAPLTLYLFTPLALVTSTWLAAGLQAVSYQIALFTTMLALLRLHATSRRRWAVLSVVAYAVGMLFWEKAVLILPTAVALLVVVVWRDAPVRERVARFAQRWRLWTVHAAVMVGYVGVYLAVTDGSERGEVAAAPYLRSALTMLAQVFVPGVIGGPWHTTGAENTLYPESTPLLVLACALVLAVVVAASFVVSGRAAVAPWFLAALYLAGDIALMLWGRADYLTLVDRDPRYLADAVPVFALCATAAFSPPDPRRRATDHPAARSAATTATALLLSSCLLTTFLLAPVLQRSYAHNYVDGLIAEFERHPGTSIVNEAAPILVAALDQRSLLAGVGYDAPFDQSGTGMQMFDSLAQLREVSLVDTTVEETGPEPDCGWPVARRPVLIGELPESSLRSYVLQLGYVTGVPARLVVEVDGLRQAVDVQPGIGLASYVVTSRSGPIVAWTRRTTAGVCVSDMAAGRPWPRG